MSRLKKILLLSVTLFALTSCGDQYDRGYDDAWEGKKNYAYYVFNPTYREGHAEGTKALGQFKPMADSLRRTRHEPRKTADEVSRFVNETGKKIDEELNNREQTNVAQV